MTSTLALFMALGGGAYAASLPAHSVGPRQLKRNAVTSAAIARRRTRRSPQHVLGGGIVVADPDDAFVIDDYPDAANTAWTARVGNPSGADIGFTVYAVCTSIAATS